VVGKVRTTVQVLVPSISPNSMLQQSVSGQMVTLRWLAYNSAYCTVEQDGQVLVDQAPADSYDCGYVVFLPSGSGPHEFKVVAHALSGNAVAQMMFQSAATGAPVTVPMNDNLGPAIVSPDGSLALLSVWPRSQLGTAMIDLNAKQLLPTVIPNTSLIAPWIQQVAVSPDSARAFVVQLQTENVAVIDLATKTVESATIAVSDPGSVACTPDGSLLLVGSGVSSGIVLVDLPSLQVEQTAIEVPTWNPGQIAITSDGTLAVVGRCNEQGDEVFLIDLVARQVVATLTVGAGPHDVAVTNDDALALVVPGDGTVRVIDIATRTVEAQPIPTGGAVSVRSLALTPDGRWAFVALSDTMQVCLIDIPARTCAPFAPLAGTRAQFCAVSPTGSAVVVVGDYRDDTATLF
jgi:DNA-binding beta-propeller fold protein YncE